jgi:hypothetical protein
MMLRNQENTCDVRSILFGFWNADMITAGELKTEA